MRSSVRVEKRAKFEEIIHRTAATVAVDPIISDLLTFRSGDLTVTRSNREDAQWHTKSKSKEICLMASKLWAKRPVPQPIDDEWTRQAFGVFTVNQSKRINDVLNED